jgi:hypothetical protein
VFIRASVAIKFTGSFAIGSFVRMMRKISVLSVAPEKTWLAKQIRVIQQSVQSPSKKKRPDLKPGRLTKCLSLS